MHFFSQRTCGVAALVLWTSCQHARPPVRPHPPPANTGREIDPRYDAGFFRALLDKEGPRGVVNKMYVGPDALARPMMAGISTATTDWLGIYERMRQGMVEMGGVGGIVQLDEALAAGLAIRAEGVLGVLRKHPEIPSAKICSRATPPGGDHADVLDARGLLGVVHRQRALEAVTDPALQAERSACLEAVRGLVRRQLRIYLASYGAPDAASSSAGAISDAESRELQVVLATARTDPTLRARMDGSLPDGPFRVRQIPRGVLRHCAGGDWPVANPEGPWEMTDELNDDQLPRTRLLNACKISKSLWDITCERGGIGTQLMRFRVSATGRGWSAVEIQPPTPLPVVDYWPDCRTLSAGTR